MVLNYFSQTGLICALIVIKSIVIKGYRKATGRPVFLLWYKGNKELVEIPSGAWDHLKCLYVRDKQ